MTRQIIKYGKQKSGQNTTIPQPNSPIPLNLHKHSCPVTTANDISILEPFTVQRNRIRKGYNCLRTLLEGIVGPISCSPRHRFVKNSKYNADINFKGQRDNQTLTNSQWQVTSLKPKLSSFSSIHGTLKRGHVNFP